VTCARLRDQGVEIESLDNTEGCGSADTGFAIDQHGDVYPCIFGIADDRQRAGNILASSIDDLWFDSPLFRTFRTQCSRPCHRCEPAFCS
jgi:radical SAM protein with 4Fe4S-binding SPASM domain